MKVLGIENRSENWKTALYFFRLFGEGGVRLANHLGEQPGPQRSDVHLELYWKGLRDYLHQRGGKKESDDEDFAKRYRRLFPDLRERIEKFRQFQNLQPRNYDVSTKDRMANLGNNLVNTEIDIVLQSPNHLFIGEAKHEMTFGANGSLVLVHQLIRQYVMAKILMDRLESDGLAKKNVIPFVVGDDVGSLKKRRQVEFMLNQCWLKEKNILSWNEIQKLHP